jgi:translocation and assembly module TamB
VLLGRTSFTQGEISFFGTKYTIDRGEVNFYNQTKIEPVINLDLQTRVRGVVVTINFSGPASKLNLSYRSDPPLQSSEILALLTVGRTPNGSVASGANVQSPTFLQGASSALLGQAVAAPITGRLQRLFGVSRVRIDPQLTGVENTAQARLTIEQQVSRDITVTFITNLNRTQQQIVSVEWDFSREFSALAIRDENGVFGLDFFYRKRFK